MTGQSLDKYPRSFEAYVQLCERRGVVPSMNPEQFDWAMEEIVAPVLRIEDPVAYIEYLPIRIGTTNIFYNRYSFALPALNLELSNPG